MSWTRVHSYDYIQLFPFANGSWEENMGIEVVEEASHHTCDALLGDNLLAKR